MKVSKLLPLIGVVIFIYILLGVNLTAVAGVILGINPFLFVLALLLTSINIGLKAGKWKLIFNTYKIPVRFTRFFKSWLVGLSLSMITPGKIGDFAKAYYLKDKATLGKSLTTVMADRIIDLLTLFILALVGISIFATFYSPNTFLLIATYVIFAAFIAAILLMSKKRIASAILGPLYYHFAPEKYKSRIKSVYTEFYSGIGVILGRKKLLSVVTMTTLVVWLGSIGVIYLVAASMGFFIPIDFLVIVFPIITLLEALPISFSGVGTRDATMVFFFSFIGISAEASISISLIYLLITYIFASLGFGIWYKNPIKLSKMD